MRQTALADRVPGYPLPRPALSACARQAMIENPNQLSEGMQYVLVSGVPVVDGGKPTAALPGKVLRGAGHRR